MPAGLIIFFGLLAVNAIIMNFSLHKLEEGHVGVYYRVNFLQFFIL